MLYCVSITAVTHIGVDYITVVQKKQAEKASQSSRLASREKISFVFARALPRKKHPEARLLRALAPTNRGKAEGDEARVSLKKESCLAAGLFFD